ncbi:hypothetical protein I4U23_026814 [Adineta vaga]|nr:hypothetical protein I4U23_026814 [Adineta vaga]
MGCSYSKPESNVVEPLEVKHEPPVVVQSLASKNQSIRIMENFVLIWFLSNSSLDIENEKKKLRHMISWLKIFNDSNECITYINTIRIEKVFLIVPIMDSWLDCVQNLPQLEKIYVLDPSFQHSKENGDYSSSSLSNTFYDIDSLCQQLKIDTDLCELDLINISTFSLSNQDGSISVKRKQQEASFLLMQLMREMLFRLKFEINAKTELINILRIHYVNDEEQLRAIQDFETNYRPQKALIWLTRECFLWRIIQRIQRTQEIDIHYKIGFFAKHVCAQLNIFQDNHSTITEKKWIVYRGKTMSNELFETLIKNNSQGLLSIATFFMADTNKELAIDFICHRLITHPEMIGIVFEIHTNSTIRSTRSPFASLEEVFGMETSGRDGILFSAYTVFRIESIEQIIEQSKMMWLIKLIIINDDEPQLLRVVSSLRSSEIYMNPLSYLGKLIMEKGDYDQAEEFFLGMLEDSSVLNQPHRLIRVHRGLGTNYMNKGDYTKALKHYQQALENSLTYLPPEHTDLVPFYDGIGNSYYKLGQYQNAVTNYEEAARILARATKSMNEQLTSDLNSRLNNAKKLLQNKS